MQPHSWFSRHGFVTGGGICRYCADPITWVEASAGKFVLVDLDDSRHNCRSLSPAGSGQTFGYCTTCGLYIGRASTGVIEHFYPRLNLDDPARRCDGAILSDTPTPGLAWTWVR